MKQLNKLTYRKLVVLGIIKIFYTEYMSSNEKLNKLTY